MQKNEGFEGNKENWVLFLIFIYIYKNVCVCVCVYLPTLDIQKVLKVI